MNPSAPFKIGQRVLDPRTKRIGTVVGLTAPRFAGLCWKIYVKFELPEETIYKEFMSSHLEEVAT